MVVVGVISLFALVLAVVCLDALGKINLMHLVPLSVYLPFGLNILVWGYWLYNMPMGYMPDAARVLALAPLAVFMLYMWVRLSVFPVRDGHRTGLRLKAMIGGRALVFAGLWACVIQAVFLPLSYGRLRAAGIPQGIVVANIVVGALLAVCVLLNGILRIFFTSKRLSILRRALMLLTAWVPFVNLAVLLYACRLVNEEYDYALYKRDLHLVRAQTDLCCTRYPLVMVHGVLFRDLKYFNYWGRIPKELLRNGASVYYGNQEAVGTIETNARDICNRIRQVMAETGCDKVNIIAHSKGGLDARRAIWMEGMEAHVASLTTINTPHHGCRFIDKACKLPDGLYRAVARVADKAFRKFGDKTPDFYTATRQFATLQSEAFNRQTPNSPAVYYQSYTTVMKNFFSDSLLCLPYLMIKPMEGENDGLVSVQSSVWGNFRGVIKARGRRGISHGDVIDLKREDYKGFDVAEMYVGIVQELKTIGF